MGFLLCLAAGLFAMPAEADDRLKSAPPDTTPYSRALAPEDVDPLNTGQSLPGSATGVFVRDAVVSENQSRLRRTDTFNDGEVSVAVDPRNPSQIVMTAFSGAWNGADPVNTMAPIWRSSDGGRIWAKLFHVGAPPRAAGIDGCPCDQTIDFTAAGKFAGAFLTVSPDNIYSALDSVTVIPNTSYFESPPGTAQATNHLDGVNDEDQPWLLAGFDTIYVAYDDFNTSPDMHVAAGSAATQLQFTVDNIDGFSIGPINPGHRLAIGTKPGTVYSLFQRGIGAGAGGSVNIDYMLNRSTDGGNSWSLNGSTTGIVVANADSTQPTPKFCTVNALLGGVDHAAVDPTTGDVIYVYGNRDPISGSNRLAMRRLSDNGSGGLTIGPEMFITGQVQAAIPSVAVTRHGVIGVFYYTCDGTSRSGFPKFTAHFAFSKNGGRTFTTRNLESFLSPATDDGDDRQRVLGDYMQVKAVGNTFYGGFTGNGAPFGRKLSNNDPIFYKLTVRK
ncbi:MAG TPA: hypothetical protein VGR91_16890 [Stellaceae bacterium]|nr:hypothetical protein [Stellaceae bacterium]